MYSLTLTCIYFWNQEIWGVIPRYIEGKTAMFDCFLIVWPNVLLLCLFAMLLFCYIWIGRSKIRLVMKQLIHESVSNLCFFIIPGNVEIDINNMLFLNFSLWTVTIFLWIQIHYEHWWHKESKDVFLFYNWMFSDAEISFQMFCVLEA